MARGNRPIEIRLDDATRDRWAAAARDAGQTLSAFIREAVDSFIEAPVVTKNVRKRGGHQPVAAGPPPASPPPRPGSCPRERFHRPGTFCKSCGTTP